MAELLPHRKNQQRPLCGQSTSREWKCAKIWSKTKKGRIPISLAAAQRSQKVLGVVGVVQIANQSKNCGKFSSYQIALFVQWVNMV